MAGMTCRPLGSAGPLAAPPPILCAPGASAQRRALRDEPAGLAVAARRRPRRRPAPPPPPLAPRPPPPPRPVLPRPGIGAPMAGAALVTGATARTVGATMTTAFGKAPGRWTDPHGPTPGARSQRRQDRHGAGCRQRKARRMNILIVDDEALARSRLRSLLSDCVGSADIRRGTVAEAANAAETMALLTPTGGRAFDLVLLDIHMPGQDGLTLAHALRTLPLPPSVVFVTAHTSHAISAFELDAVDYLTKPVRRERLLQARAPRPREQRVRARRLGLPNKAGAPRAPAASPGQGAAQARCGHGAGAGPRPARRRNPADPGPGPHRAPAAGRGAVLQGRAKVCDRAHHHAQLHPRQLPGRAASPVCAALAAHPPQRAGGAPRDARAGKALRPRGGRRLGRAAARLDRTADRLAPPGRCGARRAGPPPTHPPPPGPAHPAPRRPRRGRWGARRAGPLSPAPRRPHRGGRCPGRSGPGGAQKSKARPAIQRHRPGIQCLSASARTSVTSAMPTSSQTIWTSVARAVRRFCSWGIRSASAT